VACAAGQLRLRRSPPRERRRRAGAQDGRPEPVARRCHRSRGAGGGRDGSAPGGATLAWTAAGRPISGVDEDLPSAARRNPRCRVTALDFASVLALTRRAVDEAGCADQFEYLAGDAFEVSLPPATFDLVLLGNLCHLFEPHANRRLLRRLRPAIQPGGRIAVIDVLPSQDPAVNRSVQVYAAGLMTRTSSGGVHTEESYRAWLEEAGFHDIRVHEASRTPPTSVVTGWPDYRVGARPRSSYDARPGSPTFCDSPSGPLSAPLSARNGVGYRYTHMLRSASQRGASICGRVG
jgi:hypothetical protein